MKSNQIKTEHVYSNILYQIGSMRTSVIIKKMILSDRIPGQNISEPTAQSKKPLPELMYSFEFF